MRPTSKRQVLLLREILEEERTVIDKKLCLLEQYVQSQPKCTHKTSENTMPSLKQEKDHEDSSYS